LSKNPDRVVAVLENADVPLAHWDVRRLLESNLRRPVHPGSVQVWLNTDPRTCWGGPGIYGLYRHGLLPGIRDLGTAAATYIHASEAMSQDEARFVLQHVGYRFQSSSIYLALRRVEDEGLLTRDFGRWAATNRSLSHRLGVRHSDDLHAILQRASDQAIDALAALDARE